MEGSEGLGLGCSTVAGGGGAASMSFVPAVAKDNMDNNHKNTNFSTSALFAITKEEVNGNNNHQSPSIHNNTMVHNNNNNQNQWLPLPPSMQNHITATTLPHHTTNQYYSQPQYSSHINNIQQPPPQHLQQQINSSVVSSVAPSSSVVHYPPPTVSCAVPPVATHQSVMQFSLPPSSSIMQQQQMMQQQHHQQQYSSLPSFQPPPGMPPVVANNSSTPTSFPPPQSYYVPQPVQQEIIQPQHQIQHVLPSAPAPAPVTMMQQQIQQPMTSTTVQTTQPIIQQQPCNQTNYSQDKQHNLHAQLQNNNNDGDDDDDDPLQKARAIAMKFHKESTTTIINDTSIPTNINYAQQRQQYFQKEQQKLASFKLKNLEYIMKHEECELRKHVNTMNELTAYEERQEIQLQLHKQQCKQRQLDEEMKQQRREQVGMLNDDGCGIGTKEQRRAERVRKQQQCDLTNNNTTNNTNHHNKKKKVTLRTSLYLTNLPTTNNDNGSSSSSVCNERTLQSLFSNYGRLDRVIMYRHRDTGELKGDGLIVFGRDAVEEYWTKKNGMEEEEDGMDLVEAVCTQVRLNHISCIKCFVCFIV